MYNHNKQNSNKIKTEGIKSNQKLDLILNANYNDCKQRKEMKLYHIILYYIYSYHSSYFWEGGELLMRGQLPVLQTLFVKTATIFHTQ